MSDSTTKPDSTYHSAGISSSMYPAIRVRLSLLSPTSSSRTHPPKNAGSAIHPIISGGR
ncbi:hypothetical protein PISMIDRAFT_670673 [Pisolithus microcarpus 441]|uniref:Uncharacterized protein n=1 Tax=Pisolithus microcarpus 441 TaxID=765257 RepID=A0A0D0A852_9AGAM|nr:hypothetical protein PISMIDRAFT_670673 [Pisolithus microcarpus 441]